LSNSRKYWLFILWNPSEGLPSLCLECSYWPDTDLSWTNSGMLYINKVCLTIQPPKRLIFIHAYRCMNKWKQHTRKYFRRIEWQNEAFNLYRGILCIWYWSLANHSVVNFGSNSIHILIYRTLISNLYDGFHTQFVFLRRWKHYVELFAMAFRMQ
jgi:hypothetical protein